MKIYKYHLSDAPEAIVELPIDSEVLYFGAQGDKFYIWAKVDENEKYKEDRKFKVFGTGHSLPNENLDYIGTIMTDNGAYVWHCFEVMK